MSAFVYERIRSCKIIFLGCPAGFFFLFHFKGLLSFSFGINDQYIFATVCFVLRFCLIAWTPCLYSTTLPLTRASQREIFLSTLACEPPWKQEGNWCRTWVSCRLCFGEREGGGRFMSVHMEFRVIFPEFFQFSGRFSKAFYMLVIETHKTQFTTVLLSKVLFSLEHLNITDFSATVF